MNDDEKTGYKQPPKANQFTAGKSGNPKGRPKGTRNLKTDLNALLRKRIVVREDGETRHVSRQEAMLLSLFSKAVRGDVKATSNLLAMVMKFDPPPIKNSEPETEAVSASDSTIIQHFLERGRSNDS